MAENQYEFLNLQSAINVNEYAVKFYIAGAVVRIILLIVSLKKRILCKTYFFYEIVMLVLAECFVNDFSASANAQILLLRSTLYYLGLYYHGLASYLSLVTVQVIAYIMWQINYKQDENDKAFVRLLMNIIYLLFVSVSIHLLTSYA